MTKLGFSVHHLVNHHLASDDCSRPEHSANHAGRDLARKASHLIRSAYRFNSTFSAFSAEQLIAWVAEPEHHVVIVQSYVDDTPLCTAAVLVCHADGSDFIADGFYIEDRFIDSGLERELIRHMAHLALSCGCGAVVLPLAPEAAQSDAERLFKALSNCVETSSERIHEFAFASLAVDDVLPSFIANLVSNEIWRGAREVADALGRLFVSAIHLQDLPASVSIESATPALSC